MSKPQKEEYNPYFQTYINSIGEGNLVDLLHKNTLDTVEFFTAIPVEKQTYRYAENKWSVKDVFRHLIDTERIFSYRAIVCIRRDGKTPLSGFDQEEYAKNSSTEQTSMDNLIHEFVAVRDAFVFLFKNNPPENLSFLGNGGSHAISARALGYITIGHTNHHINMIKERYL